MKSGRVRIRIQQRDGTCPSDSQDCLPHDEPIPFPRAQNVEVSIVNDDGTETRLRNVKRVSFSAAGRSEAVIVHLELYNPVIDMVVPATLEESSDAGGGDFLGEMRTSLVV